MAAEQDVSRQHRPIRSFVRRAGRLTPSQQKALDALWPEFGVEYAGQALALDELFGRHAPVVVEIGFGNGETLVQQAVENPDHDYIGIEVHTPGVGHCLIAARKARVTNLKVIEHDAIAVLETQIPALAVRRINLYFPDPWPKKRHHKRRIIQASFLELCASRLTANGTLHIATDWANYAEHIDEVFAQSDLFFIAERSEHSGDKPLDRPMTKFERRGLRKGHRIWDWKFERAHPA